MTDSRLASSLLQLLPQSEFDSLCEKWEMDKGVRRLTTWEQTRVLIVSYLMGLKSLRDIEQVLSVPRSTLDDALRKRCNGFFYDLCGVVLRRILAIAPNRKVRRALKTLLALDASSIRINGRLHQDDVWGAKTATKKKRAAAKLTLIWNVGGEWVHDFRISGGFGYDSPIAHQFKLIKGATYVFDRGYADITLWWKIVKAGAHFVTRLKDWKRTKEQRKKLIAGKEKDFGVLYDGEWTPAQGTIYHHRGRLPKEAFRRIIYRDFETGKLLDFVTSDWSTPAEIIAQIYKKRWAIELVFRWFKGHLHIRYLDLRNKNAIKTSLAIAILTRLLLQLEKIKFQLEATAWQLLHRIESYIKRNGLVVFGFMTSYAPKPHRVSRLGMQLCEI